MSARIDYEAVAPESTHGLTEILRFVRSGSLPPTLIELVMVRASQINGCAYCLDIHSRRARRAGVPERQLDTLEAWGESPVFSEKERAALAWAESLTLVNVDHVPDEVWTLVRSQFTEREIIELSMAIVDINSWNRLMIAYRTPPTFGAAGKPAKPSVPSSATSSAQSP